MISGIIKFVPNATIGNEYKKYSVLFAHEINES
jgi:hypothetical protein